MWWWSEWDADKTSTNISEAFKTSEVLILHLPIALALEENSVARLSNCFFGYNGVKNLHSLVGDTINESY